MNNELNQIVQTNEQQFTQQPVQPQVAQIQTLQIGQVQQAHPQQTPADVLVERTTKPVQNKVDFNSLSPLEKQQLIERAIKEAEEKCKKFKPEGYNKLNSFIIGMILLCIACVVILNVLN